MRRACLIADCHCVAPPPGPGSPARDRLLDQNQAFRESVDGTSFSVLRRKDPPPAKLALTVPNGQVSVLGDNRSTSQDSRQFGTLPLADVAGIARQIWWND